MGPLSYRIVLRKEPEGGYIVLVPVLPGCVTCGKTVEEAIEMAKDSIVGYIDRPDRGERGNSCRRESHRVQAVREGTCLSCNNPERR